MGPPDVRKPALGKTGSLENIKGVQAFDNPENSRSIVDLQAARIRQHFAVSWPVALVVAELHFGRAAA